MLNPLTMLPAIVVASATVKYARALCYADNALARRIFRRAVLVGVGGAIVIKDDPIHPVDSNEIVAIP